MVRRSHLDELAQRVVNSPYTYEIPTAMTCYKLQKYYLCCLSAFLYFLYLFSYNKAERMSGWNCCLSGGKIWSGWNLCFMRGEKLSSGWKLSMSEKQTLCKVQKRSRMTRWKELYQGVNCLKYMKKKLDQLEIQI